MMKKVCENSGAYGLESGKYYVFDKHIVFLHKGNVYSVAHVRNDSSNPVDSFEKKYKDLSLSHESIISLKLCDINKLYSLIDKAYNNNAKISMRI